MTRKAGHQLHPSPLGRNRCGSRRKRQHANTAEMFQHERVCVMMGSPERMKKIITPGVREEAQYVCDVTGKPAVAMLVMTFGYPENGAAHRNARASSKTSPTPRSAAPNLFRAIPSKTPTRPPAGVAPT